MIQKIADQASRYFVGALFIFSGLIKLNDPIGTEIKMEEYFEVFAEDFGAFFLWLKLIGTWSGNCNSRASTSAMTKSSMTDLNTVM